MIYRTARVFVHVDKLCCRSPKYLFIALSVCFFASWFLALVSLVRAIGALDNPSRHIPNSNNQKGTFYGGGLFDFNIFDAFFNRHNVKAKKDLDAFSMDIPTSIAEIEMELTFEHMKVVYIRDIKATRLKWGVRFATIWLILGSSILCFKVFNWTVTTARGDSANQKQSAPMGTGQIEPRRKSNVGAKCFSPADSSAFQNPPAVTQPSFLMNSAIQVLC